MKRLLLVLVALSLMSCVTAPSTDLSEYPPLTMEPLVKEFEGFYLSLNLVTDVELVERHGDLAELLTEYPNLIHDPRFVVFQLEVRSSDKTFTLKTKRSSFIREQGKVYAESLVSLIQKWELYDFGSLSSESATSFIRRFVLPSNVEIIESEPVTGYLVFMIPRLEAGIYELEIPIAIDNGEEGVVEFEVDLTFLEDEKRMLEDIF